MRIALLTMACLSCAQAQTMPKLQFPTDNRTLLEGKPEEFFQFVDRTANGATTEVWQGGQFGFVRNPTKLTTGEEIFTRFHEGLDIKPLKRSATGEPLDEVRSMAAGEVVHCSASPGASNYGRYVVVRHDWGEGPFCSLYAHLKEISCKVGQKVEAGAPLGIMGYSGTGIDRRRAHVHVELAMVLSSRFAVWHDHQTNTLNYHGIWNGLNLVGMSLSDLLLKQQAQPSLNLRAEVMAAPAHFRVAVPGSAEMELLTNYPWLCASPRTEANPKSWEITFTAWGLPVKIERGERAVDSPVVTWARPSTVPQYSLTRGLLTGKAGTASLTSDGRAFVELATGLFAPKPKGAAPAEVAPAKK